MGRLSAPTYHAVRYGVCLAVLGAAVLYSPVLVSCGQGCAKAGAMVQGLV